MVFNSPGLDATGVVLCDSNSHGQMDEAIEKHRLRIVVSRAIQRAVNFCEKENDIPRAKVELEGVGEQLTAAMDFDGGSNDSYLRALRHDYDLCMQMVNDFNRSSGAFMRSTVNANLRQRAMPSDTPSATVSELVSQMQ